MYTGTFLLPLLHALLYGCCEIYKIQRSFGLVPGNRRGFKSQALVSQILADMLGKNPDFGLRQNWL